MKRVLSVLVCVTALVVTTRASKDDPRTPREFEEFYGAPYVKMSTAEEDRLAREAIEAQKTGICNIHHIRMERVRVPMYFGLIVFDDPFYSAELAYFPNAREHVNGGCDVDTARERQPHYRYVCPECRRAQRSWALAHPKHAMSKQILAQR